MVSTEKYSEWYQEFKAKRKEEDCRSAVELSEFLESEGLCLEHLRDILGTVGVITNRTAVTTTLVEELDRLATVKVEV